MNQIADYESKDSDWQGVYRVAGVAALVMLVLIPIQAMIFLGWPPPQTVEGHYALLQDNWLLGLLSLDLLFIVDSVLIIPIYLALYVSLKRDAPSSMLIALALALVGNATFFGSNVAFEMLALSNRYTAAATAAEQSQFLAAGEAMMVAYIGTAFNVYYMLSTIALLIISAVMLRGKVFSKATAYIGIAAGILMLVPPTVGAIGLIFSLLSLIPWVVWLFLFARRLFQLSGQNG